MKIKTLIVDDEPLALQVLENHIAQLPELELVAKCGNAIEANNVLRNEEIDLICLDIKMPQISGIDFLRSLKNPPHVIFTTAFSNYAPDGFELDVVDFLLKPISFERFMKAVNKVSERIKAEKAASNSDDDYFYVKADKKLIRIKYDDIIYIEGLKDYVIIRVDESRIVTLQTMKSLTDKLPSDRFIRVHRSYLVNVDRINSIMGNMIEVFEKGKIKFIPIGKNYKDELMITIDKKRI
ncbi:MAG: LytR/AlgR family response regulator transcription factor [Deltaproteobacteria bacterium]